MTTQEINLAPFGRSTEKNTAASKGADGKVDAVKRDGSVEREGIWLIKRPDRSCPPLN